jgi:zinc transport system substrate-binding protein
LVRVQAQTIADALVALDPNHQEDYRHNLASFLGDIDALDASIQQALEGVESPYFMVFHPAWGYFARDYSLEMISIEIGGQEPSAAELANLIGEAKKKDIKVIFAAPQFSTRSAETIAKEIGGTVLLIDPLAANWLENLDMVAETLASVLSE